ncbi:hypothetical protein MTR_1g069730 [Medicago truncatula]|uniref:Uncharacterized protein n=1 Tax=Medicago truncatula TaxID=3880 RepID=A0A072VM48_MEDTR|nr:hypothetical protein MTR_1g069730 [Medicago truncatula]
MPNKTTGLAPSGLWTTISYFTKLQGQFNIQTLLLSLYSNGSLLINKEHIALIID